MDCFDTLSAWIACRDRLSPEQSIGFVPTMGNLHAGHAALIMRSIQENDFTVVSIFVNPTQFNRAEDLENYPRTPERDIQFLESLGVNACLLPTVETMYGDDFQYLVDEKKLSTIMEGPTRPGHFTGVLTVVLKLLMLTKAKRAYFGEKDYQQYQLIKGMCKAFFIDTQIIAQSTVREADLLPYSSRNTRLSPVQRELAGQFAHIFHQPNASLETIKHALEKIGVEVEYLEHYQQRRYIAVNIHGIRLIDNYAGNY